MPRLGLRRPVSRPSNIRLLPQHQRKRGSVFGLWNTRKGSLGSVGDQRGPADDDDEALTPVLPHPTGGLRDSDYEDEVLATENAFFDRYSVKVSEIVTSTSGKNNKAGGGVEPEDEDSSMIQRVPLLSEMLESDKRTSRVLRMQTPETTDMVEQLTPPRLSSGNTAIVPRSVSVRPIGKLAGAVREGRVPPEPPSTPTKKSGLSFSFLASFSPSKFSRSFASANSPAAAEKTPSRAVVRGSRENRDAVTTSPIKEVVVIKKWSPKNSKKESSLVEQGPGTTTGEPTLVTPVKDNDGSVDNKAHKDQDDSPPLSVSPISSKTPPSSPIRAMIMAKVANCSIDQSNSSPLGIVKLLSESLQQISPVKIGDETNESDENLAPTDESSYDGSGDEDSPEKGVNVSPCESSPNTSGTGSGSGGDTPTSSTPTRFAATSSRQNRERNSDKKVAFEGVTKSVPQGIKSTEQKDQGDASKGSSEEEEKKGLIAAVARVVHKFFFEDGPDPQTPTTILIPTISPSAFLNRDFSDPCSWNAERERQYVSEQSKQQKQYQQPFLCGETILDKARTRSLNDTLSTADEDETNRAYDSFEKSREDGCNVGLFAPSCSGQEHQPVDRSQMMSGCIGGCGELEVRRTQNSFAILEASPSRIF